MLKQFSILLISLFLLACSNRLSLPIMDQKPINLTREKIDQKSYAIGYETTLITYSGRVNDKYDVNFFASGVNDWYLGRIVIPIQQIKTQLYTGWHNSDIYAYYSGVIHAETLQQNFNQLSSDCWAMIDTESLSQGIYDAMLDLQQQKTGGKEDDYIKQGIEQLLPACASQ